MKSVFIALAAFFLVACGGKTAPAPNKPALSAWVGPWTATMNSFKEGECSQRAHEHIHYILVKIPSDVPQASTNDLAVFKEAIKLAQALAQKCVRVDQDWYYLARTLTQLNAYIMG